MSGSGPRIVDPLHPEGEGPRRRITARQGGGIALAVLALVFIFQNTQDVTASFLFLDFEASMWFVTLALMLVGVAIGWMLASRRAARRRR
jgi:uncharacterized integral membrane protein